MGITLSKINEFRILRNKQRVNAHTKVKPLEKPQKEIIKKEQKDTVVISESRKPKISEKAIERQDKKDMVTLSSATDTDFMVEGLNSPLMPFQRVGVEYINRLNGRALNADEMGCVSGHAVIQIQRSVGEKKRKEKYKILLKNLYKKFNGLSKNKWPLGTRVFTHCFNTDIRQTWVMEILAVNYSGPKKVYELETTNHFLSLTGDHMVFTTKGMVETKDLKKGDCVLSIDYISPDLKYEFIESVRDTEKVIDTYDIVMEQPFHSFVANGLILKNSGKSVQSLAWVQYAKAFPLLIICPAHLKYNWKDEVEKWLNKDITTHIVTSKDNKKEQLPDVNILIINYDIIKKYEQKLISMGYKTLILDESQALQSIKSARTKAAIKISKKIPHIIALSGTPFLNRPVELFNTLNIINPSKFNSFFKFAYRFCGPKHTPWGTTFKGATNISELNHTLRESVMVRRDKKTILPQLPDKTSTMIRLEPSCLKEYNKIFKDKDIDVLPKMGILRREAVRCKINQFVGWCENFLDNSSEKLLIFGHHQEFINELDICLKKYGTVVLTGKQSSEVKHESIKKFQTDKKNRVAIGSMRAINSGYNITATSTVAFLELDWNYSVISQCYSRVHRMGQKNHVNIYYFIANETIDEHIYHLISNKLKTFDGVFDGGKGTEVIDCEANIKNELAEILKNQLNGNI